MNEFFQYMLSRLPAVPGELWNVLLDMAPYLLLGFLVAGLISVFLSPGTVERHLGGRGFWPVVKASLLGLPLPLCSCGVIPVAASLRKHGASRGATVAFLISTPQTGAENIAITYSLLGGIFAIFTPIATFLSGLACGTLVDLTDHDQPTHGHANKSDQAGCSDACCAPATAQTSRLRRIWEFGFVTLPRDLVKPLAIGLVIAAFISAFVPTGFFGTAFGGVLGTGVLGILVMMVLGIPVYVCATASIPLAWALMAKGVSPGAAFAFLLVGPATNAATIAMIWRVMGKRTAMVYLGTMMACALGGGLLLDGLFARGAFALAASAGPAEGSGMAWQVLQIASAVGVVALLGWSLIKGHPDRELAAEGIDAEGFEKVRMNVEGMDCEHCAEPIRRAVLDVDGVECAHADLKARTLTVRGEEIDKSALRQAVEALGYAVQAVTAEPEPKMLHQH